MYVCKYKGPLSDFKNTSATQTTKGELKAIGEMIVSTYDKMCKENLGKPFSEVLLVAPQLNLQEKPSAYEKKKQWLKTQQQFRASVEDMWSQTDVDAHLAQRTSLAARSKQRAYQSFGTLQEEKV